MPFAYNPLWTAKIDLNRVPSGSAVNYWSADDAAAASGVFLQLEAYLNLVSSSLSVLTGTTVPALSSSLSAAISGAAVVSSSLAATSGVAHFAAVSASAALSASAVALASASDLSGTVGSWNIASGTVSQAVTALSGAYTSNASYVVGYLNTVAGTGSGWPATGSTFRTGTGGAVASGSMSATLDWAQRQVGQMSSFLAVSSSVVSLSSTVATVTATLAGIFSVRAFGAKGDGVTNDLPAFQAATSAAYAYGQQFPNVTAAKIWIPSGDYVLSGSWNLLAGDGSGVSGSKLGYGRVQVEGAGRYNTILIFTGDPSEDAMHVGAYTTVRELVLLSSGSHIRHGVVVDQFSGSVTYAGRSGERLYFDRVYIRLTPASGCYSFYAKAPFWFRWSQVQSLGTVKITREFPDTDSGHNSYDICFDQCEITNGTTPWAPALDVNGRGIYVYGGIIYNYTPSTEAAVRLRWGDIILQNVDLVYHGVTSTASYDVIVETSGTDVSFADIRHCEFGNAGRTNSSGTAGNVWFKSGTRGYVYGNYWETPNVYISSGTQGVVVHDLGLTSQNIWYEGGATTDLPSSSLLLSDLEIRNQPSPAFCLKSPNGTSWRFTIDDSGVLSSVVI